MAWQMIKPPGRPVPSIFPEKLSKTTKKDTYGVGYDQPAGLEELIEVDLVRSQQHRNVLLATQTLPIDFGPLKQPGFEAPKHQFPGCLMEGSGLPSKVPGASGQWEIREAISDQAGYANRLRLVSMGALG